MDSSLHTMRPGDSRVTGRKSLGHLAAKEVSEVPPPKGLPSKVTIASRRWQVRYSENLLDTRGLLGHSDLVRHIITVDSSQSFDGIRETLLHEILHCMISQTTLAIELGDEEEERIVRCLTPLIWDYLRNNQGYW